MTTIRRRRPRFEFVQILNAVARDYRVSWRARGLLVELLSYPANYETSVDELVKKAKRRGGQTEGRDAMRKAARELKALGYIVENRYQDAQGRWVTENEVTDDPMYDLLQDDVSAGQTDDGFSVVGEPVVGEAGVIKKTEKKTEKKVLPPLPPSSTSRPHHASVGREDELSNDAPSPEHEEPGAHTAAAPQPLAHPTGHTEDAQTLVDDAVRLWPSHHKAPSPQDRQRLSERIKTELTAGADATAIVHELSRDLSDAGSAIRVVLGARTKTPGWAQTTDPRPDQTRHEVKTRTPWCGQCDERTRHLVVREADSSERVTRCACHPLTAPSPKDTDYAKVPGYEDTELDAQIRERMEQSLAQVDAKREAARQRRDRELAATRALLGALGSGTQNGVQ